MKKFKLSIIIDTFFIFFASLFFFYALLLYGVGGYALSITLSVVISSIISSFYVVITLIKGERIFNIENENLLIKTFNYQLFITKTKDILKLLENYYKTQNKVVKLTENSVILEEDKIEILPIIKPEEVSLADIVWVYKNLKNDFKITILGVTFSDNALNFIEELSLNISLLKTEELYKLLKETNLLPEKIELQIIKKKRLTKVLKEVFTKKHAKRFLFSGIIITIASFFTFYPLYYIIIGGILMITSVILRVFGSHNKIRV